MSGNRYIRTIGVIGGTGKEGKGLAYRWAKAGYRVLIGSRETEKARQTVKELSSRLGDNSLIEGTDNINAVTNADVVVLAVPYSAHRATLEILKAHLQGKILIDVTVPLVPPHITKVQMPPAGSAALEACQILGKEVSVASAFQNISFEHFLQDGPIESDVLVTGTNDEARFVTLELVKAVGIIGWDAGPIENSIVVEGLTSILIGINKHYRSKSAGIRIIGVEAPSK